jgi:hypothetical protein
MGGGCSVAQKLALGRGVDWWYYVWTSVECKAFPDSCELARWWQGLERKGTLRW